MAKNLGQVPTTPVLAVTPGPAITVLHNTFLGKFILSYNERIETDPLLQSFMVTTLLRTLRLSHIERFSLSWSSDDI